MIAMEIKENVAGLGKDHDKAAHGHDIAKKQSEAQPAAENLDMNPHSRNANGGKEFLSDTKAEKKAEELDNVHQDAADYAKEEHQKAADWENTATDQDQPTF